MIDAALVDARFPEPIRAILRREVIGAEGRVRALLVAGSHARGEALPGSDLDLYRVLADGEPPSFTAVTEDGVFVERTAFDAATARRKIATNPMAWATFRDGVALIDDGIAARLRAECEAAEKAWRPDPAEIEGCAHWLRAAVVKIEAALGAGEIERAAWVVSTSTFELARGIFLVNGRPIVASGAVPRESRRLPEPPDEEAFAALLTGSAIDRAEAFPRLAAWVLARLTPG